ncbi:MAG: YihY/virulence factor BrkB family protein [Anaerolineae bacterium]
MKTKIMDWWERLHPTTQSLLNHLWLAIVNFSRHGTRQAAALAYYAIFSIFPLFLLLVVAISNLVNPALASEQIGNGLRLFLPTGMVSPLQNDVAAALNQAQSFGIVALAGLAWSALGLFSNLTSSLDLIFQVPASRSMWHQRLVALLMTLILIVLVIASFITSGVLNLIWAFLGSQPNVWMSLGRIFLPMGLDMVIFALLFRFVPARQVSWDAVWPAAIFGALGWELIKTVFGLYLGNLLTNYQIVYGSIAVGIALLLYAYLTASIFLLSAEICAQLNVWIYAHVHGSEESRLPGGVAAQQK